MYSAVATRLTDSCDDVTEGNVVHLPVSRCGIAALAQLVERLDKDSAAYGIEISAEKTELLTNNTSGVNTIIKVNGQKFETVTSFKYVGSVITD